MNSRYCKLLIIHVQIIVIQTDIAVHGEPLQRLNISDLYSPVRGVVVATARVTGREVGHAVTPTHWVVLLHVTAAVRDTHARQATAAALRPVVRKKKFYDGTRL